MTEKELQPINTEIGMGTMAADVAKTFEDEPSGRRRGDKRGALRVIGAGVPPALPQFGFLQAQLNRVYRTSFRWLRQAVQPIRNLFSPSVTTRTWRLTASTLSGRLIFNHPQTHLHIDISWTSSLPAIRGKPLGRYPHDPWPNPSEKTQIGINEKGHHGPLSCYESRR